MWLCTVCDLRHLDSMPICYQCGGERSSVGRAFDPKREIDDIPLTQAELTEKAEQARLGHEMIRKLGEESYIRSNPDAFIRTAGRTGRLLSNIAEAFLRYRRRHHNSSLPAHPERDAGWHRLGLWTILFVLGGTWLLGGFGIAPHGWWAIAVFVVLAGSLGYAVNRAVSLELDSPEP